jgi:hypothetical protein
VDQSSLLVPVNCVAEEEMHLIRASCACGSVGFAKDRQSLRMGAGGLMIDEVQGQCEACGAMRGFAFDVTAGFGKEVPDTPSRLFDVAEWVLVANRIAREFPSPVNDGVNLSSHYWMWVASEQILLFFDPGEEEPRTDAFFHTPEVPEAIRQALKRSELESLRQWMRDRFGWPNKARQVGNL